MPLKRRVQKQELSEADEEATVEGAGSATAVDQMAGSQTHASALHVWERWSHSAEALEGYAGLAGLWPAQAHSSLW